MHIAHIASEMAPFVKVGGLGDVMSGLCRQQVKKGHRVTAILPKYDLISDAHLAKATLLNDSIQCVCGGDEFTSSIYKSIWNGVEVLWIESGHQSDYFKRNRVYGCSDDVARFTSFCSTAIAMINHLKVKPDLYHLHDWHTAPFALMQKHLNERFNCQRPLVLTVHNFDYQGHLDANNLSKFDIDPDDLPKICRQTDGINLLKAAIQRVDFLTTVSPNYCAEVQTPLGGRGLDLMLLKKKEQRAFEGILNGIDTSYWTPKENAYLPLGFEADTLSYSDKKRADSDQKNKFKQLLADKLEIKPSCGPWVVCVTRLVPQKGLDFIEQAIFKTLEAEGTFLLMGHSPIPAVHKRFDELRQKFDGAHRARILLEYQEPLTHWFFAAADMLIVPSIFEPCGLTQMIGMRYGAIPIVRKTGGLADSVFDFELSSVPRSRRNGFCFDNPHPADFDRALKRAFFAWKHQPAKWHKWVDQVMRLDFSWKKAESRFAQIYKNIIFDKSQKKMIDRSYENFMDEDSRLIAISE